MIGKASVLIFRLPVFRLIRRSRIQINEIFVRRSSGQQIAMYDLCIGDAIGFRIIDVDHASAEGEHIAGETVAPRQGFMGHVLRRILPDRIARHTVSWRTRVVNRLADIVPDRYVSPEIVAFRVGSPVVSALLVVIVCHRMHGGFRHGNGMADHFPAPCRTFFHGGAEYRILPAPLVIQSRPCRPVLHERGIVRSDCPQIPVQRHISV